MAESEKTAPYLPFKTFLSAIDGIAPHVPDVIDKSIWSSQSGAMQSAIMGAFRFLRLIDDARRPSSALQALVDNPDSRKAEMRAVLERAYPEVYALGLLKATPKQLDDAIAGYNVSGATHQKAVSFFIQAAAFSGLPLSPYISRRKARAVSRKRSARNRIVDVDAELEGNAIIADEEKPTTSRTIELRSGDGEVTISIKFDPFTLSADDRGFVFGLIDKLSAYERQLTTKAAPKNEAPFFIAIVLFIGVAWATRTIISEIRNRPIYRRVVDRCPTAEGEAVKLECGHCYKLIEHKREMLPCEECRRTTVEVTAPSAGEPKP